MLDVATVARGALAWFHIRPTPIAVGYEITHLCNLACDYCDRHTQLPHEMNRDEILRALDDFVALGMRHISLDGGEPLAHKHIDEVVDFLVQRGVRIYMNTNGILVPRKMDTVRQVSRVKISLDGPEAEHDQMRGDGAYRKAIAGAKIARRGGIAVQFTCVIGRHNAHAIDALLDYVEAEGFDVVFQPARNSLFLETERDGSNFELGQDEFCEVLTRIEARKRSGSGVANRWSSLRHYRHFPDDEAVPCAAGWINATLDPEGNLYHCGQVNRSDKSNNVVRLGVRTAFEKLARKGCSQCWCARVVEENYAWGARVDKMTRPRRATMPRASARTIPAKKRLPIVK